MVVNVHQRHSQLKRHTVKDLLLELFRTRRSCFNIVLCVVFAARQRWCPWSSFKCSFCFCLLLTERPSFNDLWCSSVVSCIVPYLLLCEIERLHTNIVKYMVWITSSHAVLSRRCLEVTNFANCTVSTRYCWLAKTVNASYYAIAECFRPIMTILGTVSKWRHVFLPENQSPPACHISPKHLYPSSKITSHFYATPVRYTKSELTICFYRKWTSYFSWWRFSLLNFLIIVFYLPTEPLVFVSQVDQQLS